MDPQYQQQAPLQPMQANQPRNLMHQSPAFRCLVISTVILAIVEIIFVILTVTVDCSSSYSCSWYYPSYPYQCQSYISYCCRSGYSYCGDYSYCQVKPYDDDICWGFLWGIWVCSGLIFFLTIAIIIKALSLRRRNRMLYNNPGVYYAQQQPVYIQPNQNPNPYQNIQGNGSVQNNQNGNYDYQRM